MEICYCSDRGPIDRVCLVLSLYKVSRGMVGVSRPCCEVEDVPGSAVGCGEREGPPYMAAVGEGQVVGKAGSPVLMDWLPHAQSEPPSFPLHFVPKVQSSPGCSAPALPTREPHLFPGPGLITLAQDLH